MHERRTASAGTAFEKKKKLAAITGDVPVPNQLQLSINLDDILLILLLPGFIFCPFWGLCNAFISGSESQRSL